MLSDTKMSASLPVYVLMAGNQTLVGEVPAIIVASNKTMITEGTV